MGDFISVYLDLAGPAVLAGLAAGALVNVLFGGRDVRTMIVAGGTGVIAGIVSAAMQAGLGVTGEHFPIIAAVAAGVAAGYVMRPKPI